MICLCGEWEVGRAKYKHGSTEYANGTSTVCQRREKKESNEKMDARRVTCREKLVEVGRKKKGRKIGSGNRRANEPENEERTAEEERWRSASPSQREEKVDEGGFLLLLCYILFF